MRRLQHLFLLVLYSLVAVALLACALLALLIIWPTPNEPTRAELCRALGRGPNTDYLCDYDGSLITLIESSFPPGKATIDDVHEALGPYLMDSLPRPVGGTLETYALERTLIPDWPIYGIFVFNEDGTFLHVSIQD
jgi:hypothetical protein